MLHGTSRARGQGPGDQVPKALLLPIHVDAGEARRGALGPGKLQRLGELLGGTFEFGGRIASERIDGSGVIQADETKNVGLVEHHLILLSS